jgi:hypothetical protein
MFVIQIVTDYHRPLQSFGGVISHNVDGVGAFIGCLRVGSSRSEVVTPEHKAGNSGRTVGSSTAAFILLG